MKIRPNGILPAAFAAFLPFALFAPATDKSLPDYRTVKTAITATIQKEKNGEPKGAGFLGIEAASDSRGRLVISDVATDSPASHAGLQAGDTILQVGQDKPRTAYEMRDGLQQKSAGDSVKIMVERKNRKITLQATLGPASRPMKLAEQRGLLGVQVSAVEEGEGLRVTRVTSGLPADKAGVKTGDVLLKMNDTPLIGSSSLTDMLATREAGEKVKVVYRRGDEEVQFEGELAPDESSERSSVSRTPWRKPIYRLGVVRVEFADTEHNDAVADAEWEDFFFSENTYRDKTNATGQKVYGSVNDFYRELSRGQLRVTGKVFDWIELSKNRADYSQGTANTRTRSAFFNEVLDALIEREGADALLDFDGLQFIYAGGRFPTANRGTLFWPHRGSTTYKGKRWPYIICAEGGSRMANISVFCHEFGHILGLPDQYARPENPGSEGLGAWCAMSNQSGNGRPQHFCAWCKERMGWLEPVVINSTVKQKLLLSPVGNSTNECFKVLVRADGSEYLLLENRRKQGFDQSLVADGLLIWRVVGGKLMLEESHGVDGPSGPRVFLSAVPYPSAANNAFTPYTIPSSRSQLGGGLPVHLTNIRRLDDGCIAFHIGYEYQ